MINLSKVYSSLQKYDEEIELLNKILDIQEKTF